MPNPLLVNPLALLTRRERLALLSALGAVAAAHCWAGTGDPLTICASCLGVVSLALGAGGSVWSPVLMVLFSLLYALVSWRFRYYGEIATYLLMTMPISLLAFLSWLRNPSSRPGQTAVARVAPRAWLLLLLSALPVTAGFYLLLRVLETPNLLLGTLSVTTSYLACGLTVLRSAYFPLLYAANDLVLIALWLLAARCQRAYLPVAAIFLVFLLYDLYGFLCWHRREKSEISDF